jgi:phage baseplate assembly protein W
VAQPSFLGQGILRPFRRDQKADFASAAGLALVKACVGQVLGTKADSARCSGELPWRTDFGSRLHLLRHSNNSDALADLALVMIREALAKWEPRVKAVRVVPEETFDPNRLQLRVFFTVVDRGGQVLLPSEQVVIPVAA